MSERPGDFETNRSGDADRADPSGDADREVDTRFLLANERTVLAWTRTALTLVAAGVGVDQFGDQLAAQTFLAVLLVAAGMAASFAGLLRYRAADTAIRAGRLPDRGVAPSVVAAGVVVISGLVLVAVLVNVA